MHDAGTADDGASPGEDWIEHSAATSVLDELRHLLAASRATPIPWQPTPIVCGLPGVGKTAVCDRLIAEARVEPPWPEGSAGYPATKITMPLSCSEEGIEDSVDFAMRHLWGNEGPARTTMLIVEGADALLDVSRAKRNRALAALRGWDEFVTLLVGSPELASVLRAEPRYDVIPLQALRPGPEFASVVARLMGTDDPVELDRLYDETGGVIGRTLGLARRGRLGRPAGRAIASRTLMAP